MKMVAAGLLAMLVVALVLPSAFASLEMKDVITREAYENLVNSGAIQNIAMTKTIISNPILEEALVTYANNKLGGSVFNCGETCLWGTCYTPGCSCVYRACSKDSLPDNKNKAAVSSNSKAYAKDVITREAYENLVNTGVIQSIVMTKTIISNPILEEALITYADNKLGGSVFNCGETCLWGTCYTPGCSCVYRACSKDSLPDNSNNKAAVNSNTKDELFSYAKKGLIGLAM